MVILDAGEVPNEPADRVRLAVGTERQLFGGEAVDSGIHRITDPLKGIDQDIRTRHRRTPFGCLPPYGRTWAARNVASALLQGVVSEKPTASVPTPACSLGGGRFTLLLR